MDEAYANALKLPDRYPILFTCGPLQTSTTVKQAMVVDYGSRDQQFVDCIKEIRTSTLEIAHVTNDTWASVPMQGPGTMGLEASVLTVTPPKTKYLLLNTGKYAERQGDMVKKLGYESVYYDVDETQPIDLAKFEAFLKQHGPQFSTIGYVHHETSTGMLNPVEKLFAICKTHAPQAAVLMDAISSFGGVDVNVDAACDVMVLSSNKCFHSVPGFSVCLIRRSLLENSKNRSASFTLDLYRQCKALDKTGQFPFTPPVHAMLAFQHAIREFKSEGGIAGRLRRYKKNARILRDGLRELGFETLLDESKIPENVGNMLVSFKFPKKHPKWNFKAFYNGLKARGFVIYPGKASKSDAFRFAAFGDIYPEDCVRIVGATGMVLREMGMGDMIPVKPHQQMMMACKL